MSHGIRLTNEHGISFLDDGAACFSVRESGTTADFGTVRSALGPAPVSTATLWDIVTPDRYNSRIYSLCNPQIAAASLRFVDFGSGFYGVLPSNTSDEGVHEMAFYKLGASNIVGAVSILFDFPDAEIPVGTAHILFEATGSPVEYKIVTTINTAPKVGNFGLQIYGSSGEVLFDSRDEIIAVRHAARVTAAELISIMRTGTTKTITLPEASDWWVCMPDHMPYCYFLNAGPLTGGWYDWRLSFVSVRQVGPTQIVLERSLSPAWWLRPFFGYYPGQIEQLTVESAKDTVLFFSRNP